MKLMPVIKTTELLQSLWQWEAFLFVWVLLETELKSPFLVGWISLSELYSGSKVLAYSMKTYFGITQERYLAPHAGDLILREGVGTKNTMRQYNK